MKRAIWTITMTAMTLVAGAAVAQADSLQRVDGLWMFRAQFPTGVQYVGTARFMPDGTLVGNAPDQHTSAPIGNWIRVGNQEFAFTFVADSFDTSGQFANTHRVRGMMTVSDDGLSITGRTILEILDTTGKVIFTAPFPTPFTGTRVGVQPF